MTIENKSFASFEINIADVLRECFLLASATRWGSHLIASCSIQNACSPSIHQSFAILHKSYLLLLYLLVELTIRRDFLSPLHGDLDVRFVSKFMYVLSPQSKSHSIRIWSKRHVTYRVLGSLKSEQLVLQTKNSSLCQFLLPLFILLQ